MKVNISQYAQTLLDLTDGKSEQEILVVIQKFAEQLKKDGQLKNADKIMEKFSDLYNSKNGIVVAQITTSQKVENLNAKEIEEFVKRKYGAKNVELIEVINEDIKGGIVIRVGDEVLDASLKKKLNKLKQVLIS